MIKIPKSIVEFLMLQAKKEAPIEACGYLAGLNGIVTKHYEMTNVDASKEHFTLDPKEQFDIVKKTRNEGIKILAIYHSHPESPARPSIEDIKLAYDPSISYVIISLANNKKDIKSYIIKNKKVKNEDVEVINNDRI